MKIEIKTKNLLFRWYSWSCVSNIIWWNKWSCTWSSITSTTSSCFLECFDYDLCESCADRQLIHAHHVMAKVRTPHQGSFFLNKILFFSFAFQISDWCCFKTLCFFVFCYYERILTVIGNILLRVLK
jgi:hypothetical protein